MLEPGALGRRSPAGAADAEDEAGWEMLARTVAAHPTELRKRFPDFFIVGHPKCGTTALYEMLRRHPQIHMPAKEPRFFVREQIALDGEEPGRSQPEPLASGAKRSPGWRPRTLEGYLALFAGAPPGQLVGEATPAYLRSHLAAGRIAAVRPDARIIAILREPASLLRSFHLQSVRGYNETQTDLRTALALEAQRREGRSVPLLARAPQSLQYLELVHYVEQLRRYHAVFPRERVLVLIYEDFRRDNEATVRTVLRFLDVDDTFSIEPVETPPSRDLRMHRLHLLVKLRRMALRNLIGARAVSEAIEIVTPRRLHGTLRSRWRSIAYREPGPPDESFMRELRHELAPEVAALSEYLGRDLVTLWGYDDVG